MKRALFYFSPLILSICLGCGGAKKIQKDQQKAIYYLEIGTTFLVKGKYQLALRNYLESIRLNPNNPVARNNLGLTYFGLKRYDQAYKELRTALKLESEYTDARNNLGGVLIAVGKYSEAIEVLERASADLTYLSLEKVHNNLGLAHFRSGDFLKAKASFRKALSFQDRNCQSNYYFGRSVFGLKEFKSAAESFERAVKLCPKANRDGAFFYSGLSQMKMGQKELAAGRFREVLELYPESTYAKKAKQLLEILQ